MICEITYELYKDFCSKLPCKDIFYLLDNIFVRFSGSTTIYSIKCKKLDLLPDEVYKSLKAKDELVVLSLSDFLNGFERNDSITFVKEEMYKHSSVLIDI